MWVWLLAFVPAPPSLVVVAIVGEVRLLPKLGSPVVVVVVVVGVATGLLDRCSLSCWRAMTPDRCFEASPTTTGECGDWGVVWGAVVVAATESGKWSAAGLSEFSCFVTTLTVPRPLFVAGESVARMCERTE